MTSKNSSQHSSPAVNKKRSVLVVDSERLVRLALVKLIDSLPGYAVIGEADDMPEALVCLGKKNPDILITEIVLPGPSGLELLFEVQRRGLSKLKVVVLSQVSSADMITQALLAGAQSYVFKAGSLEDLQAGLDATAGSKRYLPPEIAHLISSLPENDYQLNSKKPNDPLCILSPREREIFHLLAKGLQNTAIAQKLYISPRTVETHRARVVKKLELSSNAELIRFAIKRGLSIV